ncbi:hypothetical protein ATETN484_0015001800 [Aspergillus terreus]|nr:hypothetical protein ATETN484_0015001800 [Aspergillus terreus]
MATVATRPATGQEKRGDDLYDLFRALALAQAGYNVSESQIKAAFNDELSQPGGREAVAATIRLCGGCPPPSRLDKEVSVDNATVTRNVNEMTVNMAFDGSFPLASALASFRGGLFGKGENYLRGFMKYHDVDELQGKFPAVAYISGSDLVIDVRNPNDRTPLARITLGKATFYFSGEKPGSITFVSTE